MESIFIIFFFVSADSAVKVGIAAHIHDMQGKSWLGSPGKEKALRDALHKDLEIVVGIAAPLHDMQWEHAVRSWLESPWFTKLPGTGSCVKSCM